ncbi:MAG: single-stranded-DNA-specific exonuclease RecJ [Clostridia bacterium]|nr:single-stranded-DNA-specific exonuclease RecJ [Clostridia bacterium]
MSTKKWIFSSPSKERAIEISDKFRLNTVSSLILSARNFSDEKIEELIYPEFSEDLYDLPDIKIACERIERAIDDFEKIAIYGDFDCDGITATAILYSYLESRGADVIFAIPDRFQDGYGLNIIKIDELKNQDVKLIITVDNGIAAVEEAKYIKEKEMDLIITDHHLPLEILPECVAAVDPHRTDLKTDFKYYCGAGIAFKLVCALEGSVSEQIIENFIDLAALGTIADIVPLVGPNRYIVQKGLALIENADRLGLKLLIENSITSNQKISAIDLAFMVIPKINSAGRVGDASKAVSLFLSEDLIDAETLMNQIDKYNSIRKENQQSVYDTCVDFISKNPLSILQDIIIIQSKNLNEGVLGIAAAKLTNVFGKPSIILNEKDGILSGSARSISNFSIYEALSFCSEELISFGGHKSAAGLKLHKENFDAFKTKLLKYCKSNPYESEQINIDLKLNPESINLDILSDINALEPYGEGLKEPVFAITGMIIVDIIALGKDRNHLKIIVKKKNSSKSLEIMRFFCEITDFPYQIGDSIDIVIKFSLNEFRQTKQLTIIADNIRLHNRNDDMMIKSEKIYEKLIRGDKLSLEEKEYAKPTKEYFTVIYKFIRKIKNWTHTPEFLYNKIPIEDNYCRFLISLEIMKEFSLIKKLKNQISIVENPSRVCLTDSKILKKLIN